MTQPRRNVIPLSDGASYLIRTTQTTSGNAMCHRLFKQTPDPATAHIMLSSMSSAQNIEVLRRINVSVV
jgi:hypothetical protein